VDLTDYLRILRSRWLIVLATVIVSVVAAWVTSSVANVGGPTRSYQASTVLLSTEEPGGLALQTVASLAKIEPVARAVAQEVQYTGRPLDLADSILVIADETAATLSITATAQQRNEAERLAQAWTTELIDYLNARKLQSSTSRAEAIQEQLDTLTEDISTLQAQIAATPDNQDDLLEAELAAKNSVYGSLYQQQQSYLSSGSEPVGLEVLQEATGEPVAPSGVFQPPRSRLGRTLIGLALGLILGAGLALLVERARSPIRTKQAAEEHFGHPVIAEVPATLRRSRTKVAVTRDPQSRAANAFRLLAATLTGLRRSDKASEGSGGATRDGRSMTILVTSAGPSEGKTTVVANLSVALAELRKHVLILSCDFHRPLVHEFFGVPPKPGLADCLSSPNGRAVLDGSVWSSSITDVSVVPSGRRPTSPGELLSSDGMRRAVAEARNRADVVILDTAPLLAEGDVSHLLPLVDGVLIVARTGKTAEQAADRAREFLERLGGAPVIGIVLMGSVESSMPRRYYGYGDGNNETPSEHESASLGESPDSHDTDTDSRV
jgi:capsular exopolysaccharide synthesis family protein